MQNLILTPIEKSAIDIVTDFRTTIYDLVKRAKKQGKKLRHNQQIKRFEKMVKNLDSSKDITATKILYPILTNNNKKELLETYELDLKTTLWFASVFDDNLRYDIVVEALAKKQAEINKTIEAVNQLKIEKDKAVKELADKMFNEHDGYMSVSKAKRLLDTDLSVSEIFDILEANGDIITEAIMVQRRKLNSFNGITDKAGNPRFKLQYIKQLIKGDL